jgi:TIR domain
LSLLTLGPPTCSGPTSARKIVGAKEPLSVFICYSRKSDVDLASELSKGLALLDFVVVRDVESIPKASRWQDTLDQLTQSCAAFLLLLSPDAAASNHCKREWDTALGKSAKIVIVRTNAISDKDVPRALSAYEQIVHPKGGSFSALLSDVAEALRRDDVWYSELNRLTAFARDWKHRSSDPERSYTLSGGQVELARHWLRKRKQDWPEPSRDILDFIDASAKVIERKRRQQILERLIFVTLILLALAAAVLTSLNAIDRGDLKQENAPLDSKAKEDAAIALTSSAAPACPGHSASTTSQTDASPASINTLVAQFSTESRRDASKELVKRYCDFPAGRRSIVSAVINAVQDRSRMSSYRVNLYVLVTLANMKGWEADDVQRAKVQGAAAMYAKVDNVYPKWGARAKESAQPPIRD